MNLGLEVKAILVKQQIRWLKDTAKVIGMGFHPDTPFSEYVYADGKQVFTEVQAKKLDEMMEQCFDVLGDNVYKIGLDSINEILEEL